MADDGATGAEFPVEWDDPAAAERSWEYDPEHTPHVMTPLGFELYYRPFIRGFGRGAPPELWPAARLVNHYVYMPRPPGGAGFDRALPELDSERVHRAAVRRRESSLPEVIELTEHYRTTDFDGLSNAGLRDELKRLAEVRVRGGDLHMQAMRPWGVALYGFVALVEQLTGLDGVEAMRLVQGHGSTSIEAGIALWDVATIARSIPAVRDRISASDADGAGALMAELESLAEATPFIDAFRAFLDQYGWRSDLFEFAQPAWAEDPTIPLGQLKGYLELEGYDPRAQQSRLVEERGQALERALASLDGEQRERLSAAAEACGELLPVQEDHNFYIDQRLATLPRRLALAAGRRLVEAGSLEDAAEVFYLTAQQLDAALSSPGAELRPTVDGCKQSMARWAEVTPPRFIGAPPPDAAEACTRPAEARP